MSKLRILVDMDETLCHFVPRVLQYYAEDTGRIFRPEDITTFEMKMNLGPESEPYIRSYMRYPRFFDELEPIDGAKHGMWKLIDDGHDVMIVTAIPKCAGMAYEGKVQWIRKNLPFFNLDNFVAMKRKDTMDADILFDDGAHNLIPWKKKGRIAVAMDRPWNRDLDTYRAHDWSQFLKIVETIQGDRCPLLE